MTVRTSAQFEAEWAAWAASTSTHEYMRREAEAAAHMAAVEKAWAAHRAHQVAKAWAAKAQWAA